MNPLLQSIALDLLDFCIKNEISLEIDWVPGDRCAQAEEISKFADWDNYTVVDSYFQLCNREFGLHDFDRFANEKNHKTKLFNSKFYIPNA